MLEEGPVSDAVGGLLVPICASDLGEVALTKKLVEYRLAGRLAAKAHRALLSIAADGARMPGGKRLFGITVLPTNIAIWWPPQDGAQRPGIEYYAESSPKSCF